MSALLLWWAIDLLQAVLLYEPTCLPMETNAMPQITATDAAMHAAMWTKAQTELETLYRKIRKKGVIHSLR